MTHPTDRAEAMREACAKVCEDNAKAWRSQAKRRALDERVPYNEVFAAENYADSCSRMSAAIRALPLPAPADAGNVERAKCGWCGGQGYVEGSVNLRPYRLPCFRCDPNEKRALAEMKAALLLAMKDGAAAERAAKGGERG